MLSFPEMTRIALTYNSPELAHPLTRVAEILQGNDTRIAPGDRVGIAVGSRGICRIDELVLTVVCYLKSRGADPLIVPAMGSHGGATAEGQKETLASLGVTENAMACPVLSSMETIVTGSTPAGHPVHFDRRAGGLDKIVLINRIKPHTDFHSRYESGLIKQLVIGLGNQNGAEYVHQFGVSGLKEMIPEFAALILEKMPIAFGLAVLENAKDTIAQIHFVDRNEMLAVEPGLLEKAKGLMPTLPFDDVDLLVIETMGKHISGTGMDPNITGRRFIRADADDDVRRVRRIVCLDLDDKSQGNALGMGMADVITQSFYEKIDFTKTYANVITSGFIERGFIPLIQETDRAAIETALLTCGRRVAGGDARIVQIKNTLKLDEMIVSASLLKKMPAGLAWHEIGRGPYTFSSDGKLENRL